MHSSVSCLNQLSLLKPSTINTAMKKGYLEQRGVLRTNCLDCLDRTNVAQVFLFSYVLKYII